ncbi:MAG: polysaccharide deacetylase family protein [Anaerolineaceae bacterium]|jgi:peptidoglycan/xylan/chitin deacetylase (PgdA/CDA1 family)
MKIAKGFFRGFHSGSEWQTGVRILVFHGVLKKMHRTRVHRNFHDVDDFKEIARYLRRLNPINVSDFKIGDKRQGTIITFDDGYANNFIAAETFDKYKIPWTLFISAGCIGKTKLLWTVELSLLLLHGNANEVVVLNSRWDLGSSIKREKAFQTIRYQMKVMSMHQVISLMDELRSQFPPEESLRLLEEFPEFMMLSWDEVRQLANAGVEIGSHGVMHAIHHQIQPQDVRTKELIDSKSIIEEETGKTCQLFAFPNGDYNNNSSQEILSAGYAFGFSLKQKTVNKDFRGNILPRLNAPGTLSSFVANYYWQPNEG